MTMPEWVEDAQETTELEALLIKALRIAVEVVESNIDNGYAHGNPKNALRRISALGGKETK